VYYYNGRSGKHKHFRINSTTECLMQMCLRLINRFYCVGGTSQMPHHLTATVHRQDVIYKAMMLPLQCMDAPYRPTSAPNMEIVIFSMHNREDCVCSIISSKTLSRLFSPNYVRDRPGLLLSHVLL